jgi:predicted ABC-type ATPase
MQLGKASQDLGNKLLSLGSEELDGSKDDALLLGHYYALLNDLYGLYSDTRIEVTAAGETARGPSLSQRHWLDEHTPIATRSRPDVFDAESAAYTYQRSILHQAILANQMRFATPAPDEFTPCALLLVGGFAPATYQYCQGLQSRFGDLVEISVDQILSQIPECQHALAQSRSASGALRASRSAAEIGREETEDLLSLLLQRAVDGRMNTVVGELGHDAKALKQLIKYFRQHKYRVYLIVVDQDLETSIQRMQRHATQSGFYVPEEDMRAQHQLIESSLPEWVGWAPSVLLYDNRGELPQIAWVKEGRRSKVYEAGVLRQRQWNFEGGSSAEAREL